jgi:hypothetical protein
MHDLKIAWGFERADRRDADDDHSVWERRTSNPVIEATATERSYQRLDPIAWMKRVERQWTAAIDRSTHRVSGAKSMRR